MTRALVLAGGGGKAAFQIGVVREMQTRGLNFDVICGVSAGALNGSMIAQGRLDYLEQTWRGIKEFGDVFVVNPWSWLPWKSHRSLFTPGKILKLAQQEALAHPYQCALRVKATDLVTGESVVTDEKDPDLGTMILASASIPLILPPVAHKNWVLVDGGVRDSTPLKEAIDFGADEVHVVLTNPEHLQLENRDYESDPVVVLTRSAEIVGHAMFRHDIDLCLSKNEEPGYRRIDLRIYQPEKYIGNVLDFSQTIINQLIQHGREVAQKILADA